MGKHDKIKSLELNQKLNMSNLVALKTIVIVIMTIIGFQTIIYLSFDQISFRLDIIGIKLLMIFFGMLLLLSFSKIKKADNFLRRYSEVYVGGIITIILEMAIMNTFFAQKISSDISIYILVLFSIVGSVRMRPKTICVILLLSYSTFAIGLPFFQTNTSFLIPHLINGLIINIIAFFISRILYLYAVAYIRDKEEIEKKNEELKYMSEHDELTGLYNQRMINQYIELCIDEAKQSENSLFLVVIDVDGFKRINDNYGHAYGDQVLYSVASIIREHTIKAEFIGRYGGDEFVLMFKDIEGQEVSEIMESVSNELSKVDYKQDKLTISCGAAKWKGESIKEFFCKADAYMYEIKNSGKNGLLIQENEEEAV